MSVLWIALEPALEWIRGLSGRAGEGVLKNSIGRATLMPILWEIFDESPYRRFLQRTGRYRPLAIVIFAPEIGRKATLTRCCAPRVHRPGQLPFLSIQEEQEARGERHAAT